MSDDTASLTLTITLPSADLLTQAIEVYAAFYGYSDTLDGGSNNPQSKLDFVKQKLVEPALALLQTQLVNQAANTARDQVSAALAQTVVS